MFMLLSVNVWNNRGGATVKLVYRRENVDIYSLVTESIIYVALFDILINLIFKKLTWCDFWDFTLV